MGRLKKLRSPVLPFDVFASELNIKKSKGKISLSLSLRWKYNQWGKITSKQVCVICQNHFSEMENNKRVLGKDNVKKLTDILDCDYRKML